MRDFLKYTVASLLGLLIFMGLGIGGLLVLIILLASGSKEPAVKDKSVLAFDLSITINDSKRNSDTSHAIQDALSDDGAEQMTLRAVLDAINNATRDPHIVGLYLYGSEDTMGTTGFASLKEIREALQRFRASGKKIIAYDVDWGKREYYLGSVANTIAINPMGSLELNGFSSEMMFLAGAFQKYGIGIQVTRVGKYKSAVEPLVLTKRSPENREQTQQLLSDLWQDFLTATGTERKLNPQQLQAIADTKGVLTATDARQRGLVDRLAYQDEIVTELKHLTDSQEKDKTFRQISLKNYAKVAEEALAEEHKSKNEIAIVYAEGEIVSGQGAIGEVGGDRVARQLRQLRQDQDVKAVVLRVNSPGGSVTASEVIQREVILTRQAKPVVVSMGSLAASGGYWISTYSDRIFAEPTTITGSIGVFGIQPNIQLLGNNNGITWDVVKTGRYADSRSITRPKTPQELAMIQTIVDQIYDQFLSKVAESRKLPKTKIAEIAQGRVWSGVKAKQLGLVDQLGGLDDAIRDAAKRANLGDNWHLGEYPKSRSLEQRLLEKLAGDQAFQSQASDSLTTELHKFQADLASLRSLNDPRGIYARLPFNLRIE
jgi:protease-4